jgi:hypothetical protein
MSEQLDLLEWAANRHGDSCHVTSRDVTLHGRYRNAPCDDTPAAAQVLDGRLRFERKAAAFFGALVRGYTPPFRDSQIISLADRRDSSRSAA